MNKNQPTNTNTTENARANVNANSNVKNSDTTKDEDGYTALNFGKQADDHVRESGEFDSEDVIDKNLNTAATTTPPVPRSGTLSFASLPKPPPAPPSNNNSNASANTSSTATAAAKQTAKTISSNPTPIKKGILK